MAIQGLRDTSNFVTDQRPKNWREGILLLYPNGKAPLVALTNLMKSESTDDPEYSWWEKALATQRFLIEVAFGATDTTIDLDAGAAANMKEGHILRVENTTELMLVTADPGNDNVVPVQRGFAGTTAAAVNPATSGVNPYIHIVGNAYEEASDAPTGVNYDPTKKFNYTQIFRNTLEMSRTASKTKLRTGDAVKEAKREVLEYHSVEMEKAFWLGTRFEGTKNGKPLRATAGMLNWIDASNIVTVTTDFPSGITMTGLENYLERIFRYGSNQKMGFCGNVGLLTIQQVIRKRKSVV